MSDMGDFWRDVKEAKKKESDERKANNREWAFRVLSDRKIPFIEKNGGVHFIVDSSLGKIDYWPTTGKFTRREDGFTNRGIMNLVRTINREKLL